jgi:selenocysteine lyase/cysteine desulfurase
MPEVLPPQRDQFDIPLEVTYLNCAQLSPHLRVVSDAGVQAVQRGRIPWVRDRSDWFGVPERLRAAVARLLHSDPGGIALVPSVSYGIATAAANVPLARGQNIVLLHEQFPSNVYAWRRRAHELGATVRTVRRAPLEAWTEAVLDGIDSDTAVEAVPNFHWMDGALVDLVRVGHAARSVGAALVVDASQSFGAYPIDVKLVQPDFLVSVGYKWQLGPYGLAYLYVGPKWREAARPLEASWLTRGGAEDFTNLVNYTDEHQEGARRFDMGGYPQFVLAAMALAAVSQLEAWTVERVAATLGPLTMKLATGAEALGCSVLRTERRVGHLLGIRVPRGISAELPPGLAEKKVHVSIRGDVIRVSPHLYNTEADVERFLEVLRTSL